MDKKIIGQDENEEVDVLAVSIKPSPVLSGMSAKKIIKEMSQPSNNHQVLEKCKRSSLLFKEKK
ncbi:MAG: hypothetical protein APF84_09630 [Gracilibacter sp. BRH_c7a]|nr:MAG: hypothetical protein APF84_09630 [Gracilibacter sp. BRH_c7a]